MDVEIPPLPAETADKTTTPVSVPVDTTSPVSCKASKDSSNVDDEPTRTPVSDGSEEEDEEDEEESDWSIDEDELDAMLETTLQNGGNEEEVAPIGEKVRHFLVEKGRSHFEVLPAGWIKAHHVSGLPVYLHRPTRVVSVSRPYFLGPGSIRVSYRVRRNSCTSFNA